MPSPSNPPDDDGSGSDTGPAASPTHPETTGEDAAGAEQEEARVEAEVVKTDLAGEEAGDAETFRVELPPSQAAWIRQVGSVTNLPPEEILRLQVLAQFTIGADVPFDEAEEGGEAGPAGEDEAADDDASPFEALRSAYRRLSALHARSSDADDEGAGSRGETRVLGSRFEEIQRRRAARYGSSDAAADADASADPAREGALDPRDMFSPKTPSAAKRLMAEAIEKMRQAGAARSPSVEGTTNPPSMFDLMQGEPEEGESGEPDAHPRPNNRERET